VRRRFHGIRRRGEPAASQPPARPPTAGFTGTVNVSSDPAGSAAKRAAVASEGGSEAIDLSKNTTLPPEYQAE
jgi:hypothetical protein